MNKKDMKKIGSEKEINAFLGCDTEFTGKLVFNGAVRMDGKFTGEIFSTGNLIIGESAVINAEIKVDGIVISGSVSGNIIAGSKIELYPPGKLFGDIRTPVLVVSEGVIFEGNCQMESRKKEEGKIAVVEKLQEKKG